MRSAASAAQAPAAAGAGAPFCRRQCHAASSPVHAAPPQALEEAPATPTADGVSEPGSKDGSVAGRGEGIADDDEEQMGLGLDASPRPPNSNPSELGGEEGEEELGDSSNPFLAAGGGSGSGAGSQRPSMDDDAAAGPLRPSMDGKAAGTGGGWKGDSLDMENVSLEEEEGGAGSAHSARSSESAAGSEGAGGSSSAKAAPGAAKEGAGGARPLENGALLPAASAESPPAAGAAAAAAASAAAAAETSYQSRLMQQLTSEEDDLTVYRPSDFEAAAQVRCAALRLWASCACGQFARPPAVPVPHAQPSQQGSFRARHGRLRRVGVHCAILKRVLPVKLFPSLPCHLLLSPGRPPTACCATPPWAWQPERGRPWRQPCPPQLAAPAAVRAWSALRSTPPPARRRPPRQRTLRTRCRRSTTFGSRPSEVGVVGGNCERSVLPGTLPGGAKL